MVLPPGLLRAASFGSTVIATEPLSCGTRIDSTWTTSIDDQCRKPADRPLHPLPSNRLVGKSYLSMPQALRREALKPK